jgi:two-component system sensor histidine kinase EvgS
MTSSEPENRPLDFDELTDRCLGRLDLVDRVLERFHDSVDDELAHLEEALLRANADEIASHAHRIKGTSKTLAAHRLQECAERLEASATAGQLEGMEESIKDMKHEYARIAEAISNHKSRAT